MKLDAVAQSHPLVGRRAVRSFVGALGALMVVSALSACSSGGGTGPSTSMASGASDSDGSVAAGPTVSFHGLRLSGGYVPQPASPDVAAAYLTIDNTTGTAERLVKVVTNVTKNVMAMNETDTGSVGSMTDISAVVISAHSTYRFMPDHAHLMLEHPQHLVAGDRVTMMLTFSNAGTTTVLLPVVPIGETPVQAPSSYRSSGGSDSSTSGDSIPSMPGMNMSSGSN